ncbi:DNA-processing protein DprA [Candidatus Parcubacteria bacterium]|nr:DNA-processing protein DprA [Candidatus Parcubacteria bacterium]
MTDEIKTISIEDKDYPKRLKEIKNAPEVLYYRGKIIAEEPCFGIVGTRMCSSYGKQAALEIAGDLSEAGLTIVSGFAQGIDTFAHLGVLEREKRTIAVLGTGLDEKTIYPQSNLKIVEKVLENNGLLISEYPSGTPGSNFSFPNRNRIISGLCLGILVVEAKEKSGALITAEWARKQGRKVFALPGSIYSRNSKGCHFLIKRGAKLVENAQDILKELNPELLMFDINSHSNFKPEIKGENEAEKLVLIALSQQALYIDKIIERTKLSPAKVASTLSNLEIKNKVRDLGRNIFALLR